MLIVDLRNDTIESVKKEFDKFYDTSIFTWEGMSCEDDNLKLICKELKLDNPVFYVFSGEQMNTIYGLTGTNAYPNNLTFLSIKDYYEASVKIQVGARWFDDIVDNNRARQNPNDD